MALSRVSADQFDLIQDLKTKNASSDQNSESNQAVKTKTMNETSSKTIPTVSDAANNFSSPNSEIS